MFGIHGHRDHRGCKTRRRRDGDAGRARRDAERRAPAARIGDSDSLCGRPAVAEIPAEYQVFGGSRQAGIGRQIANRQYGHTAVRNRVCRVVVAAEDALAGEILRQLKLLLQHEVIRIRDRQQRQIRIGGGRRSIGWNLRVDEIARRIDQRAAYVQQSGCVAPLRRSYEIRVRHPPGVADQAAVVRQTDDTRARRRRGAVKRGGEGMTHHVVPEQQIRADATEPGNGQAVARRGDRGLHDVSRKTGGRLRDGVGRHLRDGL